MAQQTGKEERGRRRKPWLLCPQKQKLRLAPCKSLSVRLQPLLITGSMFWQPPPCQSVPQDPILTSCTDIRVEDRTPMVRRECCPRCHDGVLPKIMPSMQRSAMPCRMVDLADMSSRKPCLPGRAVAVNCCRSDRGLDEPERHRRRRPPRRSIPQPAENVRVRGCSSLS